MTEEWFVYRRNGSDSVLFGGSFAHIGFKADVVAYALAHTELLLVHHLLELVKYLYLFVLGVLDAFKQLRLNIFQILDGCFLMKGLCTRHIGLFSEVRSSRLHLLLDVCLTLFYLTLSVIPDFFRSDHFLGQHFYLSIHIFCFKAFFELLDVVCFRPFISKYHISEFNLASSSYLPLILLHFLSMSQHVVPLLPSPHLLHILLLIFRFNLTEFLSPCPSFINFLQYFLLFQFE
jgi:hypothetical protein